VLIEARIVIADDTFARELGARLGVSNPTSPLRPISHISGSIEANIDDQLRRPTQWRAGETSDHQAS
jgi:type II secretory pathway component HofQ